jgi:general secretion pathway protein D
MISFLAALPLLLAPVAPLQNQSGGGVPPIQDMGDAWQISFDESEDAMTLEQFVKICQENTGINFMFSKDTMQSLKTTQVRMFGPKRIPKTEFYSFFQIIMIINRFVCTRIGPKSLSVVVVASLDSANRASIKQDALYIAPDEIEYYANQPATLVQTVLHLPNMDVRTMGNSMRQLVVDPNTMQLIPIPESNSVILTGFGSNVSSLTRMLMLIDEVSKPKAPILPEFEMVNLEFASADELADTLEELLEAHRRAATGNTRAQGAANGATGALQQGTVESKIMVQPSTNSLILMAMPDDMPRIMELIARLDIDHVERERNFHYVMLENADAEDTAEVLEDFLSDSNRINSSTQGAQGANRAGGGGGNSNSSSTEVAVVPDPATNALLISASRSRFEEVREIIRHLDQPQDQVLIETALIELSGRDFLDLGVELGGANIPGGDGVGNFGVSSFGLSDFQDNDGDGIPDVRVPRLAQGITAGIINGDGFSLPLLVAAVQERRNTNVLNIPSVLVHNNGHATVETLDEQPTTNVQQNGQGQSTESFAEYVSAGITMQISPTISSGNYLRLAISLEVSNFQGSFSGSIPPPKTTRTLDTVVNVPDGDTMVIGGIIVDNKTVEKDQVPFLGDIPLIGFLFRREVETEDRTTLYFFVTPHIMKDREFADLARYSYEKKKEAAETIGAHRVRIIDPGFDAANEVESLLNGYSVPGYQAPQSGVVDPATLGIDSERANQMKLSKSGAGN